MKELFLFFLLLIGLFKPALCKDTLQSRIVLYREYNFQGSAIAYRVFVNGELLVKLKNSSYYNWNCNPGEYTLSFGNNNQNNLRIKVESGKTYYVRYELRTGFFTSIPGIILVDSLSAYPAINSGKMRELDNPNNPYIRPKNRVGMNMSIGFGFENIEMISTTNGDESKISFGGGVAIGMKYGREITKYFDLAIDFNYQFSELKPYLKNANIDFNRTIIAITPSFILPIQGGDAMRLKFGAGLDYYFSAYLNIESSKITNGFNDEWRYDNAFGYHLGAIFELNLSDKWSFNYGVKWYSTGYTFKSGDNLYPTDTELIKPNGSGIDLVFGMCYQF